MADVAAQGRRRMIRAKSYASIRQGAHFLATSDGVEFVLWRKEAARDGEQYDTEIVNNGEVNEETEHVCGEFVDGFMFYPVPAKRVDALVMAARHLEPDAWNRMAARLVAGEL
jgi:hypothetical protein